jgi:hypothetical protein
MANISMMTLGEPSEVVQDRRFLWMSRLFQKIPLINSCHRTYHRTLWPAHILPSSDQAHEFKSLLQMPVHICSFHYFEAATFDRTCAIQEKAHFLVMAISCMKVTRSNLRSALCTSLPSAGNQEQETGESRRNFTSARSWRRQD